MPRRLEPIQLGELFDQRGLLAFSFKLCRACHRLACPVDKVCWRSEATGTLRPYQEQSFCVTPSVPPLGDAA
jgi:hypothetical protein